MNAKLIEIDEQEYIARLDNENLQINILGRIIGAGTALKRIDPIWLEQMLIAEPEQWECGECEEIFDNEDEAEECCQEE